MTELAWGLLGLTIVVVGIVLAVIFVPWVFFAVIRSGVAAHAFWCGGGIC